jgi:tetratricopeptide (TPR) repeat protein
MEQPKSAGDHYKSGCVLKASEMFDQALEEFQQAVTDPEYAGNAQVQKALCLRSTARYEEAAAAFRQALELATFSAIEKADILYLLGQTLESLGRYPEALEAYGWARKEDPGYQDVARRIKYLLSGGRGPLPQGFLARQRWVGSLLDVWDHLRRHLPSLLAQSSPSLGRHADTRELGRGVIGTRPTVRDLPDRPVAGRQRTKVQRQHARVAIQCRSHFSWKSRKLVGEGMLRDLSPGGCRVTSALVVPVGAELDCSIFPQNDAHPFTIEGATVRWSRAQEFGLAFTTVRPAVQQQIAQLCRTRFST